VFGERGLEQIIRERARMQARSYRKRMPGKDSTIEKRVGALATIRRREGYMTEWSRQRDGALLLIENHCPIFTAASECKALSSHELSLFQSLLGRSVKVERTEYILEGARRCVYQITPCAARVRRKPARTERRATGPS
jgi:predicted ArsR family transcriptional regulator